MEKTIEDELETTGGVAKGEIWIAWLCLGLSLSCCLLWAYMLVVPKML